MENTAAGTPENLNLYGINFSNLTKPEVLERIAELSRDGKKEFVVTPNVDHIVRLKKDADFQKVYESAALVLTDGMPVYFTSKLLGKPIKEKISGSDIFPDILKLASEKNLSIFLLGATEESGSKALKKLNRDFPQLEIAGRLSPPHGFEKDEAETENIVRKINETAPDLLFLFLGSPKQEIWIDRNIDRLEINIAFCFGAALDFYSGNIRRAPVWMQKTGLEWFWRLLREPRRLGKRYLVDDLFPFIRIFAAEYRKK